MSADVKTVYFNNRKSCERLTYGFEKLNICSLTKVLIILTGENGFEHKIAIDPNESNLELDISFYTSFYFLAPIGCELYYQSQ